MRTTQVLLNHSTDHASAIRKRGECAIVGDTSDAHSRLPAEGTVTLAMQQRRVKRSSENKNKMTAAAARTSMWLWRTCAHRVATQAPHPRRQTQYSREDCVSPMKAEDLAVDRWAMSGRLGKSIRRQVLAPNSTHQRPPSPIAY